MLGSYPSLNLHDPETYIGVICSLLVGYPAWAAERAVEKATIESKFVPPTPGILKPLLEDEVRTARNMAAWDRGADRLRLPGPARASEAERSAHLARRRAELGPTWGIAPNTTAKRVPTREEARVELASRIGKAAFDAIPDIGAEGWRTLAESAKRAAE